jgi:ADP-ribosylglycohydrolase
VCCALYCLWARRTLEEATDPWTAAVASLRAIFFEGTPEREELEWAIRPDDPLEGDDGGYVVATLRSASCAQNTGSYEQAVKAAIGLGRDTDTTACVAGGFAGLRDGAIVIPARWREALRGMELA